MPKYLGYLATFCLTCFMNGIVIQSTGSMIPFLAAQAHVKATSYYFVFICRSIGAVVGAILYKIAEAKGWASNHLKVLGVTSLMYFVTLIVFEFWHSLTATGVLFGIYFGLYFAQNIALSISLTVVPPKDMLFMFTAVSNSSFGVGCLVAPLLVNLFTVHTLTVSSIFFLVMFISFMFFLKDPSQRSEQNQGENEQKVEQISGGYPNKKEVSIKLAVFLGLNFFLVHGLEMMVGGWISTYAVMAKIATKHQASFFATAFWLTYSITLFALGFVKSKQSTKLKRVTQLGVLSALVCSILSFLNFKLAAAAFCAVVQGASISAMYSLCLAISSQFNLKVPDGVMSTILIVMMGSEALMVGLTGYLMQVIALKVLFVSLFVFSLIMCVNSRYVLCLHSAEEHFPEEKKDLIEDKLA